MILKTEERFRRPDSVPFPSVWCRFNGRKEINGVIPKFWIQDIPEDQFEEVVNFMVEGFVNDEPLCKYAGKLRFMCFSILNFNLFQIKIVSVLQ